MFKFSPRRWLMCTTRRPALRHLLAAQPPIPHPPHPAPAPPPSAPDLPPAAYTADIHVTGPTTQFHDSVALRYNYAFGKESPFLPSNAMTANGQFLNPRSFYTAEYCGHCHQEAYHQWRQSAHSNSFRAALVSEERQHAHRRKGRAVLAPLRRLPQSRRALLRRPLPGHAQEAPLRGRRRHLLRLPLHPVH